MKTSFASLTQRVANQNRRINQGERAGTLTKDEAAALRARLNTAQQTIQNDAFDGNGSSRLGEQRKLLNGIGGDIRSQTHDDTVDPAKRTENISRRIENGLKNGSLTQQEYDGLKAKLASATTPEALKALSKEVRAEKHDSEVDVQKRKENFAARIDAGLKDGSLTPEEAQRLAGQVDQLGTTPDAATVNQLNRDIFRGRHNPKVDSAKMIESLNGRIDSLQQAGKLTPDQASAFKAQLQQLGGDAQAVGPRLNVIREQLNGLMQ